MKRFLITYSHRAENGSVEDWHRHVKEFIAAVENDAALKGRITYSCMKAKEGSAYYHLAEAADDDAIKALQQNDWFKRYTEETKRVAGGEVLVTPLEIIAETRTSR